MSPSSANATALPDRRQLLSTFAAVGAIGFGADIPAALAADHPDAELFGLVGQIIVTSRRRDVFDAEADRASQRYVAPEVPPALTVRQSDHSHVCFVMQRCRRLTVGDDFVFWIDCPEALTVPAQRYWHEGVVRDQRFFPAAACARVDEIKAAYMSWRQAIKQAEEDVGLSEAWEAALAEHEKVDALKRTIATTPATTIEGLAAKARAYIVTRMDSTSMLQERLEHLLADDETDGSEAAAISIVLDATKLGAGSMREGGPHA